MSTLFSNNTLNSVFKNPKDLPPEEKIAGPVYKVECKDCSFAYIGENKRCWASRSVEHDPSCTTSKESAIRFHAERTDHNINPRHARILEKNVSNYGSRLFLESLHSQLHKNIVNERKPFPRAYIHHSSSNNGVIVGKWIDRMKKWING